MEPFYITLAFFTAVYGIAFHYAHKCDKKR